MRRDPNRGWHTCYILLFLPSWCMSGLVGHMVSGMMSSVSWHGYFVGQHMGTLSGSAATCRGWMPIGCNAGSVAQAWATFAPAWTNTPFVHRYVGSCLLCADIGWTQPVFIGKYSGECEATLSHTRPFCLAHGHVWATKRDIAACMAMVWYRNQSDGALLACIVLQGIGPNAMSTHSKLVHRGLAERFTLARSLSWCRGSGL